MLRKKRRRNHNGKKKDKEQGNTLRKSSAPHKKNSQRNSKCHGIRPRFEISENCHGQGHRKSERADLKNSMVYILLPIESESLYFKVTQRFVDIVFTQQPIRLNQFAYLIFFIQFAIDDDVFAIIYEMPVFPVVDFCSNIL